MPLWRPLVETRTEPRLAWRHPAELPREWWRILEKRGYLLLHLSHDVPLPILLLGWGQRRDLVDVMSLLGETGTVSVVQVLVPVRSA